MDPEDKPSTSNSILFHDPDKVTPSTPNSKARSYMRDGQGQGLIETSAALALLLPLFLILLHVTAEIVHAYVIKSALTAAAGRAARGMVVAYWKDPAVADDRSLQNALVYDGVRVRSIIADSSQFADAVFDLDAVPPVVSVTVTYAGGSYGLPPFPNPDPLGLDAKFSITSTETHSLE